jgi:hypothetical protein
LTEGGIPKLLANILAGVLLFSSLFGIAQSINASKVATVHVYRKGIVVIGVSLSTDGTNIVSLTPHKILTFCLFPGYRELTLQSGEISSGAFFKAEAGGEYFFRLDYKHVVSSASLRDLRLSLNATESILRKSHRSNYSFHIRGFFVKHRPAQRPAPLHRYVCYRHRFQSLGRTEQRIING